MFFIKEHKTYIFKILLIQLLFLSLGILFSIKANADDSVLGITPEGVYPISQADIVMLDEEINIELLEHSKAKVTCRFVFKNFGEAQELMMGFPATLDEEISEFTPEENLNVRDFTARDEDGEITVSLVDTIPNPPTKHYNGLEKYKSWYCFSTNFHKNEEKTFYHTYNISFTHDSIGSIYKCFTI